MANPLTGMCLGGGMKKKNLEETQQTLGEHANGDTGVNLRSGSNLVRLYEIVKLQCSPLHPSVTVQACYEICILLGTASK